MHLKADRFQIEQKLQNVESQTLHRVMPIVGLHLHPLSRLPQ
jgi:hypothetical protein